jgi:hypothetical protein
METRSFFGGKRMSYQKNIELEFVGNFFGKSASFVLNFPLIEDTLLLIASKILIVKAEGRNKGIYRIINI